MNPLVLSVIPYICLLVFLPFETSEFNLSYKYEAEGLIDWYDDLDEDNKKERMRLGANPEGNLFLVLYSEGGSIYDQYNLRGRPVPDSYNFHPYSYDIDMDGIKEIALFTQNSDSVFLNIFSFRHKKIILSNRFITKIGGINEAIDYRLFVFGDEDVNMDNSSELFFIVSGSFSVNPRRVYRYDYRNDELISSPNTGSALRHGVLFNHDSLFYIMVTGNAYGNVAADYPFPFHDTCNWLFSFNSDLQFISEPQSFGSYPSLISKPIYDGDYVYILYQGNTDKGERDGFVRLEPGGRNIDTILFEDDIGNRIYELAFKEETIWFAYSINSYQLLTIDQENMLLNGSKWERKLDGKKLIHKDDISGNNKMEAFFYDPQKSELIVYSDKGHKVARTVIDVSPYWMTVFPGTIERRGELCLISKGKLSIYSLERNERKFGYFLLWLLIYFLITVFISSISYFQQSANIKRARMEKEMAGLQVINLRNQLDPHFVFNALNSVGNSIYSDNKEYTYDLFQQFTRLIRSMLYLPDEVNWPIKKEIGFITDYLEFQKRRFPELFHYRILVSGSIPKHILIPRMSIQIFAENAIKHAFTDSDIPGLLTILVRQEKTCVEVIVADNGVGIDKHRNNKGRGGSGKGLELMKKQIDLSNTLYKTNYELFVYDRTNSIRQRQGTIVKLILTY